MAINRETIYFTKNVSFKEKINISINLMSFKYEVF